MPAAVVATRVGYQKPRRYSVCLSDAVRICSGKAGRTRSLGKFCSRQQWRETTLRKCMCKPCGRPPRIRRYRERKERNVLTGRELLISRLDGYASSFLTIFEIWNSGLTETPLSARVYKSARKAGSGSLVWQDASSLKLQLVCLPHSHRISGLRWRLWHSQHCAGRESIQSS